MNTLAESPQVTLALKRKSFLRDNSAVLKINIFLCRQEYGGSEEGGWWYATGKPIASIPLERINFTEELSYAPTKDEHDDYDERTLRLERSNWHPRITPEHRERLKKELELCAKAFGYVTEAEHSRSPTRFPEYVSASFDIGEALPKSFPQHRPRYE